MLIKLGRLSTVSRAIDMVDEKYPRRITSLYSRPRPASGGKPNGDELETTICGIRTFIRTSYKVGTSCTKYKYTGTH